MVHIILLSLFALLTAISCMATDHHLPFELPEIFGFAKVHDSIRLETLRAKVEASNDKFARPAYALALYIADPRQYREEYVENFPTDYEGLMLGYYDQIEREQLTPDFLFSIKAMGHIAHEGNERAIQKLVNATVHSDGVVTQELCDTFIPLIGAKTLVTMKALSSVESGTRRKVFSICFWQTDDKEFLELKTKLDAVATTNKEFTTIMGEIAEYSRTRRNN